MPTRLHRPATTHLPSPRSNLATRQAPCPATTAAVGIRPLETNSSCRHISPPASPAARLLIAHNQPSPHEIHGTVAAHTQHGEIQPIPRQGYAAVPYPYKPLQATQQRRFTANCPPRRHRHRALPARPAGAREPRVDARPRVPLPAAPAARALAGGALLRADRVAARRRHGTARGAVGAAGADGGVVGGFPGGRGEARVRRSHETQHA